LAEKETIFIIDDDPGVRDSLALLLGLHGMRVQTFCDAHSFLNTVLDSQPGCALIDIRMDGMGGLELQQNLHARNIHLPVIVMTAHPTVAAARVAFKAGAIDYLAKPLSEAELLAAIELALVDKPPGSHDHLPDTAMLQVELLTKRERQILLLLVEGLSSREIADQLGISHRTVETYKVRMMKRLRVRKLSELVRIGTLAIPRHSVS
jgi:two-component system response regulator FixJ